MSGAKARLAAGRRYAPLVRERVRFAARELAGRHVVALYRPRGSGCPADNPKRFATDRLTDLGYEVHVPEGDRNPMSGPFWGHGTLWAWLPQSSSDR